MSTRSNLVSATAAAVLLGGVMAPSAMAGPSNANTFVVDLHCSDQSHYAATVVGTASESAAVHVVGGNSVLTPTVFQWHVLVTDASGRVLDETLSAPEPVHGASGTRLKTVSCSFTQFAYHDWPDVGAVTIQVTGLVQALRPN
ncbi:MAG TPA: hypothetical protein VJN29_07620 [Intrasporangium sp.]|uniref:hypothetical protein n=1 Tax=Intrasporangium sp. TaxID=1925024 RepID=UPI002B488D23|nr:hypothetical protein [Intrasporangium sp.]HKX67079.1 hypothetical protein [Intrasporangium sp.]